MGTEHVRRDVVDPGERRARERHDVDGMENARDDTLVLGLPSAAQDSWWWAVLGGSTGRLDLCQEPAELADHVDALEVRRERTKLLRPTTARAGDVRTDGLLPSLAQLLLGKSHFARSLSPNGPQRTTIGAGDTFTSAASGERGPVAVVLAEASETERDVSTDGIARPLLKRGALI